MANLKVSQLESIPQSDLATNDVFSVVDSSAQKNKKISVEEMDARWLRFETRVKDEDDMLSNSSVHVPTQKSTKAYVDAVSSEVELVANQVTALGGDVGTLGSNIGLVSDRVTAVEDEITTLTSDMGIVDEGLQDLQSSLPTTGDVQLTFKTVTKPGWILANDGTIGKTGSGATSRANDDTEALYTLFWNEISNSWCPVTGGRGASAAADFAAGKTMAIPRALGHAIGVSGAGTGLTSRAIGSRFGSETHVLTESEMPSHTHPQNSHSHSQAGHAHGISTWAGGGGNGPKVANTSTTTGAQTAATDTQTPTINASTATNQNTGGGAAHNNMQPTLFMNVLIKL